MAARGDSLTIAHTWCRSWPQSMLEARRKGRTVNHVPGASFVAGWLLLAAWAYGDPCAAKSVSDMTGAWQLFVDDQLISALENATRSFHPFKKHEANPILKPDQPW